MRRLVALAAMVVLGMAHCGATAASPDGSISLESFFDGSSYSAGTTSSLFSRSRAFTARFAGVVSGTRIGLDEHFEFADGGRLQRWDLHRDGASRYVGTVQTETGDGVLREPRPVVGQITGSRLVLTYTGYAPGRGPVLFHFRHAMQAQADGTIRSRVTIWKLGVPLAWADVIFAKSREVLATAGSATPRSSKPDSVAARP